MAIKNIIFDMGGVLVDFDAKRSLSTHFAPEYHSLINEKTFASPEWKLMDKGDYEVEDAIRIMCRDIPAFLHEEVRTMILDHEGEMPPIEGMYPIVKTLKETGWAGNSEIWVDRETGVNYLFHSSGYAGGMTVLLDRDGKPVISTIENK